MSVSAALAPPAGPAGNSSAVASATDTCSTGTFTRQSGPFGGIYLLTAYNGDFVTSPAISATFGGQALGMLVGQGSTLGNVSVEIWGSTGIISSSGVATINFTGGSVLDIALFVIEIDYVGAATAPVNATGSANGTTSPITVAIATSSVSGGRAATIVVDSIESILIGIGAMFRAASGSNMTISAGTQFHAPLNAGAGGLQIQVGTAWTQGTGGTDAIAWSESVNREWAEVTIQICGAAHDGMILRPGGAVLPALF